MAEQLGVTPPELRTSDRSPGTASGVGGHGGDGGITGLGGREPNCYGRDGDAHPVERYFQTHPPSGDAIENRQPGDELRRVAEVLTQIYGREIHLEPGAKIAQLLTAAGSESPLATYAEVEDTLRYLGPDSSAIVARELCAGSVRVFLVVNIRGEIHGYDSASEILIDWPPPRDDDPAYTFVGYLNDRGDPLLLLGERADRRFTYWLRMDEAWAELSEADRSQLVQDIGTLNEDFASAMARGVEPGSELANALAERHLALFLRIFDDYGYESHRADGRPLVTDGRFRDPLEWIAPGSARYVRDVIVANAKHHLGHDRKTVR